MAIEKPTYRVIGRSGEVELRAYDEHWLAECSVEDTKDLRLASNRAFNKLFNYISGDNQPRQKIAMTSPVQQIPSSRGWQVSFVVPRSFYEGDVPEPLNPSIALRYVPAGNFAAIRYRGTWDNESFTRYSKRLLDAVSALNLRAIGEVSSAVYNPPLTPPILRRNEVIVRYE